MKITDVRAIPLFVPPDRAVGAPISLPYADQLAAVVFGGYRATIVQVFTDEGIIGVGECMTRLAPKALQAIVEELAPILCGRDPRETEVLWELMYGYRSLAAALDIPVAAGEAAFTRYDFRDLLVQEAVDIIQPNACRTGGLSEVRKIAALSSAFHIPYAPHTGSCSAVALAVGLHIAAALPHFLTYEYMQSDWSKDQPNPLRHDLLKEPLEVFADGYLAAPPNKPGLGIELNDAILRKYTVV